jgi:very-short-patch-repair endonuclease
MKFGPMSAERRAKIAAALRGKPKSEAHRRNLSAANMGKKATPQTIAAMKAAWTGKTYEERLRVSAPGRVVASATSPDVRSEIARKRWNTMSPESRKKHNAAISAGHVAKWASRSPSERLRICEPARVKATAASTAKWAASSIEERRARVAPMVAASRAGHRVYWDSLPKEYRDARIRHLLMAARSKARPSSLETTVQKLLDALGVSYQAQVPLGKYTVDFLIESKRLIVECDGTYWHSLPETKARDIVRDAWLRSQGFTIVRLREPDIRSGSVIQTLREVAS